MLLLSAATLFASSCVTQAVGGLQRESQSVELENAEGGLGEINARMKGDS